MLYNGLYWPWITPPKQLFLAKSTYMKVVTKTFFDNCKEVSLCNIIPIPFCKSSCFESKQTR